MRRITLLALFALFSLSVARAQTPKENLENAIEIYNADATYQDGLNTNTITDEDLDVVKGRMNKSILLLDKVIREGNAEQIKTARFFKTNFYYAYFFVLGMKGRNAESYELNKLFEEDITKYSPSDFPIRYQFFDKTYSIIWDNFSSSQAEYYTGYSEVCYNMGKLADAIRFAQLAIAHPAVSPYLKYIANYKIIDCIIKDPSLLSVNERLDANLQSILLYDNQDDADKKVIKDNNYPTAKRGCSALVAALTPDNSLTMQVRCAKAAPIAAKYEDCQEYAVQMFNYCYKNKYAGSSEFNKSAVELARRTFSSGTPATRQSAQAMGDAALTALIANASSSNCEDFSKYAADYQAIGLASKGQALEKQANTCIKTREETARKQAEARKKQARRDNRNFNVYLGVDVIPLITTVDKLDYGGHLDLRGRRVAHSFGYSIINQRKDFNSSRTLWDGNRYFYAIKFFTKGKDSPGYTGFYAGYSDKTFVTLPSVTATSADGNDIRTLDLTPLDKQYEFMWNSGVQALKKVVGFDFWFGIGGSYNQLSFKELPSAEGFTFSGNDFFDYRKKTESFALKMRMGVSVGLNFGKKRS